MGMTAEREAVVLAQHNHRSAHYLRLRFLAWFVGYGVAQHREIGQSFGRTVERSAVRRSRP